MKLLFFILQHFGEVDALLISFLISLYFLRLLFLLFSNETFKIWWRRIKFKEIGLLF